MRGHCRRQPTCEPKESPYTRRIGGDADCLASLTRCVRRPEVDPADLLELKEIKERTLNLEPARRSRRGGGQRLGHEVNEPLNRADQCDAPR